MNNSFSPPFPYRINDKKESFYSVKEDKDETKEFETGPLSILMQSVKQNTQVNFILDFF